jgi:hypothetical protein
MSVAKNDALNQQPRENTSGHGRKLFLKIAAENDFFANASG